MGSKPSQFHYTRPGPLRLYSTKELINMPAPTWMVEGLLPSQGLVGCYGQPGSGKSFVAIDLALCVATGHPWQGKRVEKGFVLYVSAEGGSGIGKRVLAWLLHNEIDPSEANIAWLVESIPINTDSEQMEQLVARIVNEVGRHPDFIIIDTLARCFDGDENLQEDMGRFIAGVDYLCTEFGSTVLVVHHTRLGAERERGSTAFRGAADTMIKVEKNGDYIDLMCDKQKDAEEFEPIGLELLKIKEVDSCVVQICNTDAIRAALVKKILEPLLTGPLKWDDWFQKTETTRSEFMKTFQSLKAKGIVVKMGDTWKAKVPEPAIG